MAVYVDDLDRTIIVDDVPSTFRAIYADSAEELLAFCKSHKVRLECIAPKPYVTINVAWCESKRVKSAMKWGLVPIRYNEAILTIEESAEQYLANLKKAGDA